jgi:TPR repeat protein
MRLHVATVLLLCFFCSKVCAEQVSQSAGSPSQKQAVDFVYAAKRVEKLHDFSDAFTWYKSAASLGAPDAMYDLGWFYFGAYDIPGRHFQNYQKAAFWFQKAAELNYVPALSQLGVMYSGDGSTGVPANAKKAAELFLKAAKAGDPLAMENLGVLYSQGRGIPIDIISAQFWWKKAVQADPSGPAGQAAQSWLNSENGASIFLR